MNNIITQEEKNRIDSLCINYDINNYTINPDGSIDVVGDVSLSKRNLSDLPLRFGVVSGHFYCNNNQLTSLEGCPTNVGGSFECYHNRLTSLEFCPTSVDGDFDCSFNKLTSLEYCPKTIVGNFECWDNELTSLEYFPTRIGDYYDYNDNRLPKAFMSEFPGTLTKEEKTIFIKYMNDYDVWTPGFSKENLDDLILDIKDGLQ